MELKTFFAQDAQGNIQAETQFSLYLLGTSSLATGLQDEKGEPLPNPFMSDTTGKVQVAAPNGRYDLRGVKGSLDYTMQVQFSDVSEGVAAASAASAKAKSEATAASASATAAAAAAEDAAAVVSGGEGSLTPAPGKIPLADSKGNISPDWFIVDQLRASVEAASGGKRTVLYNVDGTPSYMNIFTKYDLEDLPGAPMGEGPHSAFIRNGVVKDAIMVGSFQASNVGGKAVSQPGVLPWRSINYDNSLAACEANGPGWTMVSNLDWAAIALWCMANGFEPRGNTMSGKHHVNRWETGRGGTPCLTGSGPISWSHDGTPSGIFDLVGNVWEWVTGLKLENGRVWLAPDNGKNDEADLIDTGYDLTAGTFATRSTEGASDLLRQSLVVPASAALSPVGQVYVNAEGARFPYRGGRWLVAGNAGLGALSLNNARTHTLTYIGFRPAFAI